MSKPPRSVILMAAMVLVAAGSFAITLAQRTAAARSPRPDAGASATQSTDASPAETLLAWLEIPVHSRAAIVAHDPTFPQDLRRLREQLNTRRNELAATLEQTDSSDELIRQRVEAVIAASADLERRVTEHLLTIRDHLTPQQQKRLLDLCAQGLRQRGGHGPGPGGWRWRQSSEGGPGPGRFRGARAPATSTQ
ncbi:hypothetical protein [Fontivita pretiosa]|jgi:Spy/CpxP family protein refolding chaperone|uniref:hypothetical protein n=1 Tax=Fontivita pretiosa TaxID=2989684 RepID=UPI003D1792DD